MNAARQNRSSIRQNPWAVAPVLGILPTATVAVLRSSSELIVCGMLVIAYLGRLIAEDRRLRHQTESAAALLRTLRDTEPSARVRIVLPGMIEVDCTNNDEDTSDT